MKNVFIFTISIFIISAASASDYGDQNCNIFVSKAGNEITGGFGNYISATVIVTKSIIYSDFQNYSVRISGYEDIKPTKVFDIGDKRMFTFQRFRKGIYNQGAKTTVIAYIDNGIDRLFDNNDNVVLERMHNWQYSNPYCN